MEPRGRENFIFYYTASWCGPCQAYTPSLVEFYNQTKPGNDYFELVLITNDSDQDDMTKYAVAKPMPWPQLKFSKVESFTKKFDHGVSGIPAVIVCDLEGKIVAHTRDLNAIKDLVKKPGAGDGFVAAFVSMRTGAAVVREDPGLAS